ncbi:MAG: trehalose-6-phosphate synthase [Vampirovibrionales bacterium]|nr:trehalose-6-phosphate synthase [Vampirovibrionales bacterium]
MKDALTALSASQAMKSIIEDHQNSVTEKAKAMNKDAVTEQETVLNEQRLVIVSNREPYTIKVSDGSEVSFERTPGGLVSALDPVLRKRNGLWICWEGAPKKVADNDAHSLDPVIDWANIELPYEIQSVTLSETEINHYYYGYANTRIWPLFHYFVSRCNFLDERDWPSYLSANQKFAEAVITHTNDDDLVWVQDYHLLLVPNLVRARAPKRKIGFFLHIPFPVLEVFKVLPRRQALLEGMLGSDLIGFHVPEYVEYFLDAVEALMPVSQAQINREASTVTYQGRVIKVAEFPISIDVEQIETLAASPEVQAQAQQVRQQYPVKYLGLSVDRLDYTKGILENFEAIRIFFEKYPQYITQLTFVQIAAPTRTEVPAYRQMKEEIEQAVGRINGALSKGNWSPIQYFYRSFPMDEVLPYFIAADFCMITPLRDGMNLVAKEYCATKLDNRGILLLSEFTGAASELTDAFTLNPYHIEGMADTLHEALTKPQDALTQSMAGLRRTIQKNTIHDWVNAFLSQFEQATTSPHVTL